MKKCAAPFFAVCILLSACNIKEETASEEIGEVSVEESITEILSINQALEIARDNIVRAENATLVFHLERLALINDEYYYEINVYVAYVIDIEGERIATDKQYYEACYINLTNGEFFLQEDVEMLNVEETGIISADEAGYIVYELIFSNNEGGVPENHYYMVTCGGIVLIDGNLKYHMLLRQLVNDNNYSLITRFYVDICTGEIVENGQNFGRACYTRKRKIHYSL